MLITCGSHELKRETSSTNEIGVAIPLLDQLGDLAAKTVTADALLTQTAIASYLRKHDAHYMFVAKDNQKTLLNDIRLWFHDDAKRPPDFAHHDRQAHQRQAADRARTLGTARNLDHHRAQRLSPVPRRPGRPSSFAAPAAKCARAGSPTPRSTPPGA